MRLDWLTLVERIEANVEAAESFARRHRTMILTLAAGLLLALAWWGTPATPSTAEAHVRVDADSTTSPPQRETQTRVVAGVEHDNGSTACGQRPSASSSEHHQLNGTISGGADGAIADSAATTTATEASEGGSPSGAAPSPARPARAPLSLQPSAVWVHVAGAVATPGVVRLPAGARGFEAVRAAGGLDADADLDRVNLSRRVPDESMLVVPRRGLVVAAVADTALGVPSTAEPGTDTASAVLDAAQSPAWRHGRGTHRRHSGRRRTRRHVQTTPTDTRTTDTSEERSSTP
jgi:hypothetical protein